MIEAAQRCMSLELARELTAQGGDVICVYADSLFVDMPQLPLLPAPWRLKEQLTGLQFLSAVHFVSPQLTRLPGVSRSMRATFGKTALQTRSLDRHGLPVGAVAGTRIFRPFRKGPSGRSGMLH
jgi:hypothetical protein